MYVMQETHQKQQGSVRSDKFAQIWGGGGVKGYVNVCYAKTYIPPHHTLIIPLLVLRNFSMSFPQASRILNMQAESTSSMISWVAFFFTTVEGGGREIGVLLTQFCGFNPRRTAHNTNSILLYKSPKETPTHKPRNPKVAALPC